MIAHSNCYLAAAVAAVFFFSRFTDRLDAKVVQLVQLMTARLEHDKERQPVPAPADSGASQSAPSAASD